MIFNLQYISVVPMTLSAFDAQVHECLEQIALKLKMSGLTREDVIKQTVFIRSESNGEYLRLKQQVTVLLANYFEIIPPVSIISQHPENGFLVAMELMCTVNKGSATTQICHNLAGQPYLKLVAEEYQAIIASGVMLELRESDILRQAEYAFQQMDCMLKQESMDFSDILRQWNYIERIVGFNENNGQHYQIFNDVRSQYYSQCQWTNGYPAATGIGMHTGGVIIDFIAVKPLKNCHVAPLKSPVQVDAHQYSERVLLESHLSTVGKKTTPKFERAKVLLNSTSGQLYVSGTAAIKGEETISVMDVAQQMRVTLQNISELCAPGNLLRHGIAVENTPTDMLSARIYVKEYADIETVKQVFQELLPNCEALFLCGEICRPDLLVEVEGIVDLQLSMI